MPWRGRLVPPSIASQIVLAACALYKRHAKDGTGGISAGSRCGLSGPEYYEIVARARLASPLQTVMDDEATARKSGRAVPSGGSLPPGVIQPRMAPPEPRRLGSR